METCYVAQLRHKWDRTEIFIGRQPRQPVPMGAMAQQLYQLWSSRGAGGQDFSSIINLLKNPAGS